MPQALSGEREPVGIFFGREFGRMDADELELAGKGALEAMEIRENMDAVDAAGGPEIQQDDLAAQVVQPDRR